MDILITNDDSINAKGIKHLYHALKDQARVRIVAPMHEKSGAALSMSLTKPLRIKKAKFEDAEAYTVNGTPADCVKLGIISLYDSPPDLIVSGINRGSNAGRNVLYSGTIGGVIEGLFRNGIPGIAFSSCEYEKDCYQEFEKYIFPIVEHTLAHPMPQGTFLNVNFPKEQTFPIKGIKYARQGMSFWTDDHDRRLDPDGNHYYWLGGKWRGCDEHEANDVHLLDQGYIAATPIHVDELTDRNHFESHKTLFEESLNNLFD